jgi:hypothetical protein
MSYRVLPVWVVAIALAVVFSVPGLKAEEKNKGEKGGSAAAMGHEFHGRIVSVDPAKRQLVLEVHNRGPGQHPGAGSEKGATKGPQANEEEEKGGKEKGGSAAEGPRNVTFHVANNAKITLDDQPASLEDLKDKAVNHFAMVRAHRAERGGEKGGATSGKQGTQASAEEKNQGQQSEEAEKGAAGQHGHLVATEIHAHTHRPQGAPTGGSK